MTFLKLAISFAFFILQFICNAQSLCDSLEKKLAGKKWKIELESESKDKPFYEHNIGDTVMLLSTERHYFVSFKLKKNGVIQELLKRARHAKKSWDRCGNYSRSEAFFKLIWVDSGTWKISENSDAKITLHLPRGVYKLINPEKLLFVLIQDLTPKN